MTLHKKPGLFETPEGDIIVEELKRMSASPSFLTGASYAANSDLYPENSMSFVQKHVAYLRAHPATDPQQYLSNLRLMTRVS